MRILQPVRKTEPAPQDSSIIKCFVFSGQDFLGWDCFQKRIVSVGSSQNADILLDHPEIQDIHAIFYRKGNQVVISDKTTSGQVRVNGQTVRTYILKPLDMVSIGPFTLKLKLNNITEPSPHPDAQVSHTPEANHHQEPHQSSNSPTRYKVIFNGRIADGYSFEDVKLKIARRFCL